MYRKKKKTPPEDQSKGGVDSPTTEEIHHLLGTRKRQKKRKRVKTFDRPDHPGNETSYLTLEKERSLLWTIERKEMAAKGEAGSAPTG